MATELRIGDQVVLHGQLWELVSDAYYPDGFAKPNGFVIEHINSPDIFKRREINTDNPFLRIVHPTLAELEADRMYEAWRAS